MREGERDVGGHPQGGGDDVQGPSVEPDCPQIRHSRRNRELSVALLTGVKSASRASCGGSRDDTYMNATIQSNVDRDLLTDYSKPFAHRCS